jgi:hypothetical protein
MKGAALDLLPTNTPVIVMVHPVNTASFKQGTHANNLSSLQVTVRNEGMQQQTEQEKD